MRNLICEITKDDYKEIKKFSSEIIEQIGMTSEEIKAIKKRGNQKIEDLVRNFLICCDLIEGVAFHPEISEALRKKLDKILRMFYYKRELHNVLLELEYSPEKDRQLEEMQELIRKDISNLSMFINFVLISTQVLSSSGKMVNFDGDDDEDVLE